MKSHKWWVSICICIFQSWKGLLEVELVSVISPSDAKLSFQGKDAGVVLPSPITKSSDIVSNPAENSDICFYGDAGDAV